MIASERAGEVRYSDFPLESLVSLLLIRIILLMELVALLELLIHLGKITHSSGCIWTGLLLAKAALFNRVKVLVARLNLSSLLVLISTSC